MLSSESVPATKPTIDGGAVTGDADGPVASAVMPRFGSAVIDLFPIVCGLLIASVLILLGGEIVERLGSHNPHADGVNVNPGLSIFVVAFLYIGGTESRRGERRGQTWGKQAGEIRTVTARRALPPSLPQVWVRAACVALFTPIVAPFPFLFLFDAVAINLTGAEPSEAASRIAFLSAMLVTGLTAVASRRRRAWFDRLAGTTVITAPRFPGPPSPDAAADAPRAIRGIPVSTRNVLLVVGWPAVGIYSALMGY